MGEQLQKVSMKWSAATLQHEAELLNAFAGLVEGRSQLSRVTMKIAWRLVRTVGILRVIEEFVQDKPCETAPDLVAQSLTEQFPAFPSIGQEKKPLTRATHRRVAREGQAINGVSRRMAANEFAGMRVYWPLRSHYHRAVPQGAYITLAYGGIFLFCGVLTVLALVEKQPPKMRFAAMAMGINWLVQGVFAWVLAANHGKVMVRSVDLNEFFPQFLAIVCFAWLALAWNAAQPESARQQVRDEVAMTELQHVEAR